MSGESNTGEAQLQNILSLIADLLNIPAPRHYVQSVVSLCKDNYGSYV